MKNEERTAPQKAQLCLWSGAFACYLDSDGGKDPVPVFVFTVARTEPEARRTIDKYLIGHPEICSIDQKTRILPHRIVSAGDLAHQLDRMHALGYRWAPAVQYLSRGDINEAVRRSLAFQG